MPAHFLTPKELAATSGIPYIAICKLVRENKLVVLKDSQGRSLINVDRFMSALRPDLEHIGYTYAAGGKDGRIDTVEPIAQDLEAMENGDPEPRAQPARGPSQPATIPASRTRRRTKTARTQGVTGDPVAAGEPS